MIASIHLECRRRLKREKKKKRGPVWEKKKGGLLDHFEEAANVDGSVSLWRHSAALQNRLDSSVASQGRSHGEDGGGRIDKEEV